MLGLLEELFLDFSVSRFSFSSDNDEEKLKLLSWCLTYISATMVYLLIAQTLGY